MKGKKAEPNRKLKAWRALTGITQIEMAEKLGLSSKAYNYKENGRWAFKELEINMLLDLTGLTYEQLFLGDEETETD